MLPTNLVLAFAVCYSLAANHRTDDTLRTIIIMFCIALFFSFVSGFFAFPFVRQRILKQKGQKEDKNTELELTSF